jgi:cullin-4
MMFVYSTVKPTLPDNFEEETWQKLRAAIHAIHEKQPIATSLEELYKVPFSFLCSHIIRDS